ncbi:MAG TPA: cytochrome c oxidase subunit II [Candidatus Dormibacteraeota bacterium]|nr:cytochrome c oxidase subunit II [Candidatus Dormibacteraeota bacterium]
MAIGAVLATSGQAFAGESVTPPHGVSSNGTDIYNLYLAIAAPAIFVFILVEALIVIVIVKFRRKRADEIPTQTHGHTILEIVWTVIPLIIVIVIGVASFITLQKDFGKLPDNQTQMDVEVTGQQFKWTYTYTLADGKTFSTDNTLTVPANTTVRVKVDTKDVIHSWWVPDITGKTDAVPGYDNYTWFNISQPGHWHGECAELCGVGHANMQIDVVALSPSDFQTWESQQVAPASSASSARKS